MLARIALCLLPAACGGVAGRMEEADAGTDAGAGGGCVRARITIPLPDAGVEIEGGHIHPETPVPERYRRLLNPYGYDDPSLAALGAGIYAERCQSCHGTDGKGCGPEADRYQPPPADLNLTNLGHPDPYFYWRIEVGDDVPGFIPTAMPAFGDVLGQDEIWRVITYIRWTFVDFLVE